MPNRRILRVLVVLTALAAVALGLFAAFRGSPALRGERDSVSVLEPADQSAVLAPERRAPRSNTITPVDPPVTVLVFEIAGLVALLALATARFAPRDDRASRRDGWFCAWSLRGPPSLARVTLLPAA